MKILVTGGAGFIGTNVCLEAISEIEDQTGKKADLSFQDKRHGDQDIWISDITKIKTLLGWEPTVTPFQGIKKMIEEYSK